MQLMYAKITMSQVETNTLRFTNANNICKYAFLSWHFAKLCVRNILD